MSGKFAPSMRAGILALLLIAAIFQVAMGQDAGNPDPVAPDPVTEVLFSEGQFSVDAQATSIYWGAYIQGDTYGVQNAPWDTRAIDQFEAHAGKRISILHWGQAWQRCAPTCAYQEFRSQQPQYEAMRLRGIIPMVDWASWNSSVQPQYNQPNFALSRIIAGDHDAYIRRWASEARAWGYPFFLRFNWEMNGNWFPWSETRNGNSRGQYVAAWRHVRDIFRAEGVTNAKWVWCPNVVDPASTVPLSNYYPGSKYVDWMCMDGYNWGTNPSKPYGWKSFTQLFWPTYSQLLRLSHKPIMIGETSSSEYGGSKAAWITDMLQVALPQKFPRVAALVWFNWNTDGMDWVIETSPSAQAAFAKGISSPYYRAQQYGGITIAEAGPEEEDITCVSGGCLYLPIITTP